MVSVAACSELLATRPGVTRWLSSRAAIETPGGSFDSESPSSGFGKQAGTGARKPGHSAIVCSRRQSCHPLQRSGMLDLSPSGYYGWLKRPPSARARRDAELKDRIMVIWSDSGEIYGCPRIHAMLLAEGEQVGRKRVARLMRELGIGGRDAQALQDGHDPQGRQGPACSAGAVEALRASPDSSLRRSRSLPLSTGGGGTEETTSDTINPKNHLSVKAGQLHFAAGSQLRGRVPRDGCRRSVPSYPGALALAWFPGQPPRPVTGGMCEQERTSLLEVLVPGKDAPKRARISGNSRTCRVSRDSAQPKRCAQLSPPSRLRSPRHGSTSRSLPPPPSATVRAGRPPAPAGRPERARPGSAVAASR